MESMIHHFKQVMEGPRPPIGEVYVPVESPKGEKGYYMVSDGTAKPVRWRIRPPSFVNLSAIPKMVEGHLLSDVIAINAQHRHRHGGDRPVSARREGATQTDAMTHSIAAASARSLRPVFAGALKEELDALLGAIPRKWRALLPALWIVQHERGWVSEEAMAEVASVLELTPAYVKGVVTFYTMYHQHPVGTLLHPGVHDVAVRRLRRREGRGALLEQTGCGELGATSPDGQFTVIEVECLGACGFATPIMVNDEFIESVTPDKVPQILAQFK